MAKQVKVNGITLTEIDSGWKALVIARRENAIGVAIETHCYINTEAEVRAAYKDQPEWKIKAQ